MGERILIDPVTRIEGHAKITISLDDDGKVADALFHVTQFRGFEKFVEGRPMTEMPSLMARICGICPVSHLIASAKACDAIYAVAIPETAVKLRRLMDYAQFVQSHALSLFHLSGPDLLLGMDADEKTRNVIGLIGMNPDVAKDGIRLRQFGQTIIEMLGGKRVHPSWLVPGGVNAPLSADHLAKIAAGLPAARAAARRALALFKGVFDRFTPEIESFANFPTMYVGLVNDEGNLDFYDGKLRFCDERGELMHEVTDPARYVDYIGEAVEDFTFLKFPYYLPRGYPDGIYRVGPLARLVVSDRCGTPEADSELEEMRARFGRAPQSSFLFHWARLIELIHALEVIDRLIAEPDILDPFVRSRARYNRSEGVAFSEAPRGTLIHHYKIDENGQMRWVNLIIATGHNNLAMNRGVKQVAQRFVDGNALREGMLNRVEAVIRCFDPCLSCSTHAAGQMPLVVELRDAAGNLLQEVRR